MGRQVTQNVEARSASPANAHPVIAHRLDPEFAHRLARHPSRPRLIELGGDTPVWTPPAGAEVLFTFASAWWTAPDKAPEGWPFDLKWVQLASAGVDAVPHWAYDGVTLTCSRGITARPIAQHVLHVLLEEELKRDKVCIASRADALRLRDETIWRDMSIGTLAGRQLGLIGFGAIGQEIAKLAHAFGMKVTALRRGSGVPSLPYVSLAKDIGTLLAGADHAVICAPLTPETRHLVNDAALGSAKPGLHLVNIARGPIIDHDALARALDRGLVGKATLDVTEPEPLPEGHRFYTDRKVRLTPHIAWFSPDHHDRLMSQILENLDRYVEGQPLENIVDPAKGY